MTKAIFIEIRRRYLAFYIENLNTVQFIQQFFLILGGNLDTKLHTEFLYAKMHGIPRNSTEFR
jgi:hypothetical protein